MQHQYTSLKRMAKEFSSLPPEFPRVTKTIDFFPHPTMI
ncbi:hypothetical protein M127_4801 [Bacteroides fragilis str. S6L5]|nr:hypothetical protein M127_4801 [Bacteroides fragilis str. S6L5]